MTAANHAPQTGRLLLVPTPLDYSLESGSLDAALPRAVVEVAATLTHWVVESPKAARAFLKRVDAVVPLAAPLAQQQMRELPRPPKGAAGNAPPADWDALLAPLRAGHDLGLLSDAGLPGVADPGALLVRAAHEAGFAVCPLAGASSLTLALAASGLNGQRFAFEGYLPQDAAARQQRVAQLQARSRQEQQTQVVIETPYRNPALLDALLRQLDPGTRLAVAAGLTTPQGWCRSAPVADWRRGRCAAVDAASAPFARCPAVFLWLA